jgi:hypothetical protein
MDTGTPAAVGAGSVIGGARPDLDDDAEEAPGERLGAAPRIKDEVRPARTPFSTGRVA